MNAPLKVSAECKLQGMFSLTVLDELGNRVEEKCTRQIPNLITNYGLDQLCGTNTALQGITPYCAVGSSSTTPQFTDISLGSQLGTRTSTVQSSSSINSGSPLYYHSYTRTYAFTQGQIVGNVAEVGLFDGSAGSNCVTHALIKDGVGAPTTITLLSTETLYITYELRFYPVLTDTSGSVVISGTTYAYTQRTRAPGSTNSLLTFQPVYTVGNQACYETNTLPALGVAPSGSVLNFTTVTINAYSTGSFTITGYFTAGASACNFSTGIGLISWGSAGEAYPGYHTAFTPKIPKLTSESNKTLTINFSYTVGRL